MEEVTQAVAEAASSFPHPWLPMTRERQQEIKQIFNVAAVQTPMAAITTVTIIAMLLPMVGNHLEILIAIGDNRLNRISNIFSRARIPKRRLSSQGTGQGTP